MGDLQYLNINPDEEVQGGDFAPIPAGDYNLLVEDVEIKRTKDGEGQYIALKLQVLDGQYKGRLIFDRITVMNRNDKAVEIGRKSLIIWARVLGKQLTDSAQLMTKTIQAKVKIKPEQNGYPAGNEVAWYIGPVGSASAAPEVLRTVVHPAKTTAPAVDDSDCPF